MRNWFFTFGFVDKKKDKRDLKNLVANFVLAVKVVLFFRFLVLVCVAKKTTRSCYMTNVGRTKGRK